jgi:tRNA/tmRNA/rRNA uracil-C5-methylase (TrmA/RlmC/RlmD family)
MLSCVQSSRLEITGKPKISKYFGQPAEVLNMEELTRLLLSEHRLHVALLDNESKKRKVILQARGRELESLSRKTEELMEEVHKIEEKRRFISDSSFAEILSRVTEPQARNILEAHYQSTLFDLQAEIQENHKLLERSTATIHRLLTDLGQDHSPDTYAPVKKPKTRAEGLLLNATG